MKQFLAIIMLMFALPAFGTTYYVSKSLGSDSYDGTEKAHTTGSTGPWQHVPGMASGPSHTPTAGDQFILYGGDTWGTSDLPMEIDQNGSGQCLTTPNSSCIYIGVDQTWYNSGVCGASWCRPIFSQGGVYESGWYAMAYIYGTNVTLDNIEFTGMKTSGGNTSRMLSMGGGGGNDVIEHSYFHGWNHDATGCPSACTDQDNSVVIAANAPGNIVHDNVIDGADTLTATAVTGSPCQQPPTDNICQGMNAGIQGAAQIYNNVVANVTNGIGPDEPSDIIHDNLVGPIWLGYQGGHRNGIQNGGPTSLSYQLIYNNVLHNVQNNGMFGFMVQQGGGSTPAYVFNNMLYAGTGAGAGVGEGMQFCQLNSTCGPIYSFNNTIESSQALTSSYSATIYSYNNHCIGPVSCIDNQGSWTVHEATDLPQCSGTGTGCADANSSPHYDQYTSSQTYADSPVASTNSTVHAGTSEEALCSTISGLNAAAGTACQNATGYACNYNTSNHTISCPDLALNSRGGTWDIGAYQYTAGGSTYTLTVTVTGSGSVSDSSGVIVSCTASSGTCSGSTSGSDTLTETPSGGYTFSAWGGACSGSLSTCTLTISATTSVTATFTASTAPTSVTTTTATSITSSSASSGGSWTCTGGCATITSEGVCYAVTTNPTTPCTSDGTSTPFTSSFTGLSAGTTYYYRAFATNSAGTTYGSDLNFTTSSISAPTLAPAVVMF